MDILVQGHKNDKIITRVIYSGIFVFNGSMLKVVVCFVDVDFIADNHG